MKDKHVPRLTVLVTGCGSGIGLALAKRLVRSGNYNVAVTAREASMPALIEQFKNEKTAYLILQPLDVTDSSQIRLTVERVVEKFANVDVLINNAGICYRGVVEHMDEEAELDQIRTNYLGPLELIRKVLPLMRERKTGCIINVSSVSGIMAMPTMGSYSASKFAMEAASEALWYETRGHGIRVHLAQPGFVHSISYRNVKISKKAKLSAALRGPHSEYYHRLGPVLEKLMSFAVVSPDKIAERIITLIHVKYAPLRVPVTFDAHVFSFLRKILPDFFFGRLMLWLLPGRNSVVTRRKRISTISAGV